VTLSRPSSTLSIIGFDLSCPRSIYLTAIKSLFRLNRLEVLSAVIHQAIGRAVSRYRVIVTALTRAAISGYLPVYHHSCLAPSVRFAPGRN